MMNIEHKRWFGLATLFKPEDGITIYEPPANGEGYWIGAPGAIYDDEKDMFYLYYRRRKPRGQGRGYECGISESKDGINFSEIWKVSKDLFGGISVERSAIVKCLDGKYRLYISYVDPKDNKWKIDMISADSPKDFDPNTRRLVVDPNECGVEGVKDPYVMVFGGVYYMFISYAPTPKIGSDDSFHKTADVFNTGKTSSNTGLALSSDGIEWKWVGDVMSPPSDENWNAYATRVSCAIYTPPIFNVFYDGGSSVGENYEEKTGLAITFDFKSYHHVSEKSPILTSPHSTGSLRYMDAIKFKSQIFYYYEYARADGSHELRVNRVDCC
ncbi:TPA: hypothetical protein ENS27_16590 [bacterium]|nr:hypothetical protein [bacterium]